MVISQFIASQVRFADRLVQFPVVIDSRCIVPSHKCHVFSPFLIAEDLQFVFKALKIDRTKFETALDAPLQTYHVTVGVFQ